MATPANVLHGISTISLDGSDLGYTEAGVSMEKGIDMFEKEVDQELDALDIMPTKWTITVRTQLAEVTLNNLYLVWNETAGPTTVPGVTRTQLLGVQQTIPEHILVFVGTCPEGNARTYTLNRAKSIEASEHTLQKGDKIVFPVAFRCLLDFTLARDRGYGTIVDTL